MRSQVEERTCRQMFLDRSTVLDYSGLGCQCRLNRGGILFRRTRYQQGSLRLEERKRGSAVWVYRWWENDITGKPIRRKVQLGSLERYPNESAACAAADALRLTINNQSKRKNLQKTTVNTLWEHYCREEMPLKEISTQDAYLVYGKNWILPRWGSLLLEDVKTIEVERWLRAAEVADGTKAKIKCVMSAVFSHAVRWEFCGHNPISSGIPVGTGGQRGPSTGVRVSAKRQKSPLVLSPEEVIDGSVGKVIADASESEAGLAGVEIAKSLQSAGRFRLSFRKTEGKETARLGFGVEEEDPAGLQEDRHHRRRLAHLSAHGGNHAGRDGRTPIDDPRLLASQRSARDQQVSPGNDKKQTPRAGEARGCHSARGRAVGKQINLDPLAREVRFFRLCWMGRNSESADGKTFWTQTDPDRSSGSFVNHSKEWRGRRDWNA